MKNKRGGISFDAFALSRVHLQGLLLAVAFIAAVSTMAMGQDAGRWSDPRLSSEVRADRVLAEMTLDEKIAMVNGTFGGKLRKNNPAEARIGAGHVPGVPRLGIPDLYETDASLGVANSGAMRPGDVATALPSSLALASSFDSTLAFAGGAMIGSEARAKGFNVLLAGGANLIRDPWNGRDFEYFSEDVLLTGRMAGESIRGVQSNQIVSTLKHFALNAQESGRYVLDARLSEEPLRESDLLAFQLAIEQGRPGSVMCGYNKVDGDWNCENRFLLTDVLKHDWGYAGWVMSDWGAVHSTDKAALAGLDQESGQELDAEAFFAAPLKASVRAGRVPQSRLDDMVRRILRTMFACGLVDNPTPTTPQHIDYLADAAVAQRVAEEGMVLLKNDRVLLPISQGAKRILVFGAHADVGVLSGGGSSQVQAVSGSPVRHSLPKGGPQLSFIHVTYQGSSPLNAIRARDPAATVSYVDTSDPLTAAALAKTADLVLVFAEQWRSEALDLSSLALDNGQDALIDAVAKVNPHTVVVVESGGPVLMPWLPTVGAVIEAWYPGERGGEALARVLYGDVDAAGRLPVTFPETATQAPRPTVPGLDLVQAAAEKHAVAASIQGSATVDMSGGTPSFPVDYPEGADVGYRWYERRGLKPLFPFGFGLSYTKFAYRHLSLNQNNGIEVSFTVANVGGRGGIDVPQVYATTTGESGRLVRRLVGFQRVSLNPGQTQAVKMVIDPRLLSRYDARLHAWRTASRFRIEVGHDAMDIVLSSSVAEHPFH